MFLCRLVVIFGTIKRWKWFFCYFRSTFCNITNCRNRVCMMMHSMNWCIEIKFKFFFHSFIWNIMLKQQESQYRVEREREGKVKYWNCINKFHTIYSSVFCVIFILWSLYNNISVSEFGFFFSLYFILISQLIMSMFWYLFYCTLYFFFLFVFFIFSQTKQFKKKQTTTENFIKPTKTW